MKSISRRIVIALMILMLAISSIVLTGCGSGDADPDKQIDHAVKYLQEQGGASNNGNLLTAGTLIAGDSMSDWIAITLYLAGAEDDYSGYLKALRTAIESRYETKDKLSDVKATEWHRIALAITACGGNPTDAGKTSDGDTINLIADGTYSWSQTDDIGMQGTNAYIYALITLDSGNYKIPKSSKYTRDKLIGLLLDSQNSDGSFGLAAGAEGDVDMTAMALQALSPYYLNKDSSQKTYTLQAGETITVKHAADRSLSYLSEQQSSSGMYSSGGVDTSESCSQMIIALCSLGIDPAKDERFVKKDGSVVDALMEFKTDKSGFSHTIETGESESIDNVMSSQQACLAFIALKKFNADGSRLYDFK